MADADPLPRAFCLPATVGDPPGVAVPADPARIAAALRRAIVAGQANASVWQGYGDALHALGFATRAERAWRRAGSGRNAPSGPVLLPARPGTRRGVRLHLSCGQPPPDEQDRAGMAGSLGANDYSYGFAMRNFHAAIASLGLPCAVMRHPEYIPDIRDRSDAAHDIHLAFYPPERLRLLKGAYNIACFAWEFDRLRLPAERPCPHAFADQATMLSRVDEMWLPSRHGAMAVAASMPKGARVRTVPAPVPTSAAQRSAAPDATRQAAAAAGLAGTDWRPLAIAPGDQAAMDDLADRQRQPLSCILAPRGAHCGQTMAPPLFLTVLNPHDYRKQLRPMLHGFVRFRLIRPNAMLLVKLSTPHHGTMPVNRLLLEEQIAEPGVRPLTLASDRIWITDAVLTRAEMTHLYDAAAFYLCTAHAEGQNLPLLEAMGRGVVPVSVAHTAMADYIRPDNAVPIRSTRQPFGLRLSGRYGMTGLDTNAVTAGDVVAALATAAGLDDTAYAARSAAACATVRRDYGAARLAAALQELIARIAPAAADG